VLTLLLNPWYNRGRGEGMTNKISLCTAPSEYFQERVTEAMSHQGFEASKVAEYYIVDLLARYMITTNLFDKTHENTNDTEPLAVLLLKAQSSELDDSAKVKILKKLGDTSLYISGFFADSLNRKVIDLDYYREMGAIAYRSLSGAIKEDSFQELYGELHNKFSGFVNVLTEVSQEVFVQNNQNLLRLYEVYVRTGSELARKQLQEKGLPTTVPFGQSTERNSKN